MAFDEGSPNGIARPQIWMGIEKPVGVDSGRGQGYGNGLPNALNYPPLF